MYKATMYKYIHSGAIIIDECQVHAFEIMFLSLNWAELNWTYYDDVRSDMKRERERTSKKRLEQLVAHDMDKRQREQKNV